MAIFFTSDRHLGHKRILEFDGRPFDTIEEMNKFIIEETNRKVKKGDILYMLGDIAFYYNKEYTDLFDKINCKTRFLIKGNHDNKKAIKEANYVSVDYIKKVSCQVVPGVDTKIIMCHFPIESREGRFNGWYHIHGHSHQNLTTVLPGRLDISWNGKNNLIRSLEDIRNALHPTQEND